jgi:hypothetical protein
MTLCSPGEDAHRAERGESAAATSRAHGGLAGNIETQRRVDLASVRQQIGLQQGAIGTELRQQREVLGRLVSERTR